MPIYGRSEIRDACYTARACGITVHHFKAEPENQVIATIDLRTYTHEAVRLNTNYARPQGASLIRMLLYNLIRMYT